MDRIDIRRVAGTQDNSTILRLFGPLTLRTLGDLRTALEEPGLGNTIVDLAGVPFVDSAGLGALLSHWTNSQKTGAKFAVVGASERVQTLFRITKIIDVLPIFANAEAAERSFASVNGASSSVAAV